MSEAITWYSPKMTMSQLPFHQWGMKPTLFSGHDLAEQQLVYRANLLRNFISFYHQAYRVAVWSSRQNCRYVYGLLS